jgi:hypothetical protein
MNATSICNLALGEIGAAAITSLDEASQEARVCKRFYDKTRDEALRAHHWNFATKRCSLTRLSIAPAFGWEFQYQLPSDFLRARSWNNRNVWIGAGINYFQIEQDRLLSNDEESNMRYIFRQEDATKFDSLFTNALSILLASKIAAAITGSVNLTQQLLVKYNFQVSQARRIDASEDASPIRNRFSESALVRSRFYSDIA